MLDIVYIYIDALSEYLFCAGNRSSLQVTV